MIIDAMRGQGVSNEFVLVNKGKEYKVIPSFCENVLESEAYIYIRKMIEDKVGTKDVNLCSNILENLMLYLSDVYPENIGVEEYANVACVLHYYVAKMYDESLKEDYFESIYGAKIDQWNLYLKDLESACSI